MLNNILEKDVLHRDIFKKNILEKDILIKNNYYITDNHSNDEFHIVVYYLEDNKCKIKIRRMECIGWGQDLKIIIKSIDNENESYISLGSCNQNIKTLEIYTNVKLYKMEDYKQIIPKVIIQTSNENLNINNKNIYYYNSIISFIELNPEYEYKLFDDNECRNFIVNNINLFYKIHLQICNTI